MDISALPPVPGRRSARLAAWGSAWLAGAVSHDDTVATVTGEDAHHAVRWPGGGPEDSPLGWALGRLRGSGARSLALALPAPGDPGLAGPTPLGRAALSCGEAVVTVGAGEAALGLVPRVTRHGSAWDGTVTTVCWEVFPAGFLSSETVPVAGDSLGVAQADLTATLRRVTDTLVRLDVASWRPEVAEALATLRSSSRAARPLVVLPPGVDPRAQQLLDLAERLAVVVALASADTGAAVSGWEARDREAALRELAASVRRARVAAVNAPPYGASACTG